MGRLPHVHVEGRHLDRYESSGIGGFLDCWVHDPAVRSLLPS